MAYEAAIDRTRLSLSQLSVCLYPPQNDVRSQIDRQVQYLIYTLVLNVFKCRSYSLGIY